MGGARAGWLAAVAIAAVACDAGEPSGPDGEPPAAGPSVAQVAHPPAEVQGREPPPRRLILAAVGDILFGRYALDKQYRRVPTDEQPFADLAPLFDRADVVIGNLESPVIVEPDEFHVTGRHVRPDARWSLTFRADPAELPLLAVAGFDVLSLANNHARDLGPAAVAASRRNVDAAGLLGIGAGRTDREARAPAVIDRSGVRVAIIARTVWLKGLAGETDDGAVALLSNRRLVATITDEISGVRADTGADFVVVSIHWGHEYELEPDDSQRRAAHAMIDAGADVVLGHHPHVVQTFERYRGGVIAYSLGNFLFDTGGREPRRSAVLELDLDASGDQPAVAGARLHPVLIHPDSRAPRLARRGGYRSWARDLAERAPAFEIAPEPAQ